MTIRALLNSGRSNETALEKAADVVLAFPRLMWHGRSVKVEMQANGRAQLNEDNSERWGGLTREYRNEWAKMANKDAGIGDLTLRLLIGPVYLVCCVLAAPLLGIGLLLKKIAISQDPAAAKVSNKVEQFLRNEKLIKKDGNLRKECAYFERKIKSAKNPYQEKMYENYLMRAQKGLEEIYNEVGPAFVPHLVEVKSGLEREKQEIEKKREAVQVKIATLQEESQEARVHKATLKVDREELQLEINKVQEEITSLEKKIELLKTKQDEA